MKIWSTFRQLLIVSVLVTNSFAKFSLAMETLNESDSEIIWKKAKLAFADRDWENAARDLETLLKKYPTHAEHLEARLRLGLSYLNQKEYKKSFKPLKYYIASLKNEIPGHRARLALGTAYLENYEYALASLNALEIINANKKTKLPNEIYLESLLQRSWAQIGLNQILSAKKTLASYWSEKPKTAPGFETLDTLAQKLGIDSKILECNIGYPKTMTNESEVRGLYQKRGRCLLEALNSFKGLIEFGTEKWTESARNSITQGIYVYDKKCKNPPDSPSKMNQDQKRFYRAELKEIIAKDCEAFKTEIDQTLLSWETRAPEGKKYHLQAIRRLVSTLSSQ